MTQMKPVRIKYKSTELMELIDSYNEYVEVMEIYIAKNPEFSYTIELIPGDYMHILQVDIKENSDGKDAPTNEGEDPSSFIS